MLFMAKMQKDDYLNFYYENISFQGELQLSAIKMIAEERGQGIL